MSIRCLVIILLSLPSLLLTISCNDDPYVTKIIESRLPIPKADWQSPVAQLYRDKIKHLSSLGSWIAPHDCDSLLFNGIARAAGIESIDLSLAEHEPNVLHRRPYDPCWLDGEDRGSKSTISNDMIVGWVLGQHAAGNAGKIKEYYERARRDHWIIGKPISVIGRVVLKPNLQAVLRLAFGSDKPGAVVFFPVKADYERHLQALLIEFVSRVNGGYTENMLDMLEGLREVDDKDALFFAASDMREAAADRLLSGYIPSYIRGSDEYPHIYQAYVARLILK